MDGPLYTIVFIAWAHMSQACTVVPSPPLLVVLKGEKSTIMCEVYIPPNREHPKIKTWIFFKDNKTTCKTTESRNITYLSVPHNVYATETGNYKCQASCSSKTGDGTFIYVRDSGYRDPITPTTKLQSGLIALFVLLLLPSILGSYLVLPFFWKKQVKRPKPPSASTVPPATQKPTSPQPLEETSGSVYASLQTRCEDVYDVLEEDTARKTNMKHQAEVHSGPGPMKRPKPQAPPTPVREKPRLIPDKPPTKQKTNKASADHSLYENFKR